MEIIFNNCVVNNNTFPFRISSKKIIGITGDNLEEIIDIIKLHNISKETIIDGKVINNSINNIKSKIVYTEDIKINNSVLNIYELMKYIMIQNNNPKNSEKRIKDALRIVGLDKSLLNKNINDCSQSEKNILNIAMSLLLNPDIIIISDPFKGIDLNNQKKLYLMFKKICDQYNKTIIFASDNINTLYKYTNDIIIYKNHNILLSIKTKDLYKHIEKMMNHKVEIPEIMEFIYQSKKRKKVKIDYHQDIRDLIKDIYKHV